jgi:hypothetical protein
MAMTLPRIKKKHMVAMLSGILYVNKILQFYQPRQDALTSSANVRNMRIVCDNEGLITAI